MRMIAVGENVSKRRCMCAHIRMEQRSVILQHTQAATHHRWWGGGCIGPQTALRKSWGCVCGNKSQTSVRGITPDELKNATGQTRGYMEEGEEPLTLTGGSGQNSYRGCYPSGLSDRIQMVRECLDKRDAALLGTAHWHTMHSSGFTTTE